MSEQLFASSRVFRIWSYTVGHKELLVRSTKEASFTTRIDVLFVDVVWVNLPTILSEIEIVEADEREREARRIALAGDQKLWLVRGRDYAGHVVGGGISTHEDDKEFDDPSYWHDLERIRSGGA